MRNRERFLLQQMKVTTSFCTIKLKYLSEVKIRKSEKHIFEWWGAVNDQDLEPDIQTADIEFEKHEC